MDGDDGDDNGADNDKDGDDEDIDASPVFIASLSIELGTFGAVGATTFPITLASLPNM